MNPQLRWGLPLAGVAWLLSRVLQGGPSADPRTDYAAWSALVLSPYHPLVEMLLAATLVLALVGAVAVSHRAAWALGVASAMLLPVLGLLALGEPAVATLASAADAERVVQLVYLHPLFLALSLGGLLALGVSGVTLGLGARREGAPAWAWLGALVWPPFVILGSSLPFAAQLLGPALAIATGIALALHGRRRLAQ